MPTTVILIEDHPSVTVDSRNNGIIALKGWGKITACYVETNLGKNIIQGLAQIKNTFKPINTEGYNTHRLYWYISLGIKVFQ